MPDAGRAEVKQCAWCPNSARHRFAMPLNKHVDLCDECYERGWPLDPNAAL